MLSEAVRAEIRRMVEARLVELGLAPSAERPVAEPAPDRRVDRPEAGRTPFRPGSVAPAGELTEGDRSLWVPPVFDREPVRVAAPEPVRVVVPAEEVEVVRSGQEAERAFVREWERLTGRRAPDRRVRGRVR